MRSQDIVHINHVTLRSTTLHSIDGDATHIYVPNILHTLTFNTRVVCKGILFYQLTTAVIILVVMCCILYTCSNLDVVITV